MALKDETLELEKQCEKIKRIRKELREECKEIDRYYRKRENERARAKTNDVRSMSEDVL